MGKEEVLAVEKVLESGWLAEGSVTKQFEDVVAKYVGAKYAVAVCNCTVALELCLKTYNLKRNRPIEIPAFGHPATIQAIINTGLTPVLVDVDLETYNVQCFTQSAHMSVSWGGNPCIVEILGLLVEDAACSLGSEVNGRKTGAHHLTCFSFHPRKLVTTGEGGMITCNDRELSERIRNLKNFGVGGGNYKFDDVRAAIGLEQMKKIDGIIDKRIEMAKVYNDLLRKVPDVITPTFVFNVKHTYQTYAVYLEKGNRNKIIKQLATKQIESQVGAYALHVLPQYNKYRSASMLSNSEKLHCNLLALPMSYTMTENDQVRVVEELKQAMAS